VVWVLCEVGVDDFVGIFDWLFEVVEVDGFFVYVVFDGYDCDV